MGDLDDAVGQHVADHGDVAEAHGTLRLEHQNRAGLGRVALGVAAGGLLPPGAGVTENLDARKHARKSGALPVLLRLSASARKSEHGHGEQGTNYVPRHSTHLSEAPSTTLVD